MVSCDRGDRLLAISVQDGAADLARCVVLRNGARELLGDGDAEVERIADRLVDQGAGSRQEALADAQRFLAQLRESPDESTEPVELDGEDVESLAREVLGRGLRLRFVARGRSMRPQIPHGSTLEIERRGFAQVRPGMVVLFSAGTRRLVAHRVIRVDANELRVRGDSSPRIDRVNPDSYLGVVIGVIHRTGKVTNVSSGARRWMGRVTGFAYALAVGLARCLVIGPMNRSLNGPSWFRGALRSVLRIGSAVLLRTERWSRRWREGMDPLRAALMSTTDKDRERMALYQRHTVQDFTALDENVNAGLTLIEEVVFSRHELPTGDALVLGCGPGRECMALAQRGYQVLGIDREPGMLERARDYAAQRGLDIEYAEGEAQGFDVGREFDLIVVFSGLINMVLPRSRRVGLLQDARRHLRPGGRILVTFLSAYVPPGQEDRAPGKGFLEALNPEHEAGDQFLLNETIHVYPRATDLVAEANDAGLECVHVNRDQRAYDRAEGRVRGYAVLRCSG